MLRSALIISAALLASCVQTESLQQAGTPLDRPVAAKVFSGGTIYTGVGPQTTEAVAVDMDGRIVWTGTTRDLETKVDTSGAERVQLDGAVMYPGFTDGHAHLLGIGERELSFDLTGTPSLAALLERVRSEVRDAPEDGVIVGRGWIETDWPEGRMPTAADLDTVAGDHIVLLSRADGHALVASSAALEAAGITDQTPDVDGGKIERNATGQATGLLIDNAMGAVAPLIAKPGPDEIRRAYVEAGKVYTSRGWTGVHNMSVPPADAKVLAKLDSEGKMPLRLWNAYKSTGSDIAAGRKYETDTITNRAVKLYMDGALGSRGALLIEPYSDRPDTNGLARMTTDDLAIAMEKADREGYQLSMHAIGDLANRRIINAFEAGGYDASNRWRIEHAQIIDPSDLPRVAELGLIASMQPSHAIGDLKFAPDRLGMERLAGAYAWQSLLDAGAVVVGGSDAPVEVGSPLIEFYAAVARKGLDGETGEGWHPEEAISRADALALFTSAAAYAAFMENDLGTIEPGKIADFTVFDRDLMTVPEDEILDAKAMMTVVRGEIVWQRPR